MKYPVSNQQLYCALDLETTGFDPLKEEILEVGFVFFTLHKGKTKAKSEYSQIFQPSKTLRTNIQGLTGITQQDTQSSPKFSEAREEIQEKLKDAILVGHNIAFDIKFLQATGITLSGKSIDTQDLVQMFLPTYHSYNLENLCHHFKLNNKTSHRALDDAKSAMKLFAKCVQLFQGVPREPKKVILKLLEQDPLLHTVLSESFIAPRLKQARPVATKFKLFEKKLKIQGHHITMIPPYLDYETTLSSIKPEKSQVVFLLPDTKTAFKFWAEGLVKGVFLPKDRFSQEKFNLFLKKSDLTWDEAKFAIKILVWIHTNWQKAYILDLNLNFSGGQFKHYILDKDESLSIATNVATTLDGLQTLNKHGKISNYQVIALGVDRFEHNLLHSLSTKVSWGNFIYELKQLHNPITGTGKSKSPAKIIEALSATDLFFGLTMLRLQKLAKDKREVSLETLAETDPVEHKKLLSSALLYATKLRSLTQKELAPDLKKLIQNLEKFFALESSSLIKWFELNENHLSLHATPIEASKEARKLIEGAAKFSFVSTNLSHTSLQYYQTRLRITDFAITQEKTQKNKVQITLFNTQDDLVRSLTEGKSLPAVIVFSHSTELRAFYDAYYKTLSGHVKLFAERLSGGNSKILKNYTLYSNSLLLCTSEFLKKAHVKLKVHSICIVSLPQSFPQKLYNRLSDKSLGVENHTLGPEELLPEIFKTVLSKNTKKILLKRELHDSETILKSCQDLLG